MLARRGHLALDRTLQIAARNRHLNLPQPAAGYLRNLEVRAFWQIRIHVEKHGTAAGAPGQTMRGDGLREYPGVKELRLVPRYDHRSLQPQSALQPGAPFAQRPVQNPAPRALGRIRRSQRGTDFRRRWLYQQTQLLG